MCLELLLVVEIISSMFIQTQIILIHHKEQLLLNSYRPSSKDYDREKYLEMLLDSAETALSVFGFNRSLYGFSKKKSYHWWEEQYRQQERDIESAKTEL